MLICRVIYYGKTIGRLPLKKIIIVLFAAIIMPALLVLTALIPRSAIREHSLESAQYLYEHELFGYEKDGIEGSCIDRYADAILLNIAYHFDSEYPLKSVMLSAYYFTPEHEENENYLIAVRDDLGITRQYLRYWHGSIALVRPLLLMMNVQGIYIFNAVVLVVLFIVFVMLCARIREYPPIIAFAISFIMTRSWYVPLCLEYTWMFMIMLAASVLAIIMINRHKEEYFTVLFAAVGMVTSFFDFLTTETLTLLMPLLVIIWLTRGSDNGVERIKKPIVYTVSWGIGYAGMWASKWLLCSIVMHENALPYVTEHVSERISGTMGIDTSTPVLSAITKNIACLFPLGYGALSVVAFIVMIIAAVYIGYVYRREDHDKKVLFLLAAVSLVPFVRYIVLHNHSYLHFFFTFRAQAATVAAIVLIVIYLTEKSHVR